MKERLFYILLFLALPFSGHAARFDYRSATYNRLAAMPSDKLLDLAYSYLDDEEKRDSALLCYTILANKYYTDKLEGKELKRSVLAMSDIGYMYYFYYYDYQKAYHYFYQSLRIAEKENLPVVKGRVYLNLANLYRTYSEMNVESGFDRRIVNYYKQSFYQAVQVDDRPVVLVAFYGLCHYAYLTHTIPLVRKEMAVIRALRYPAKTPLLQTDRYLCDALEAFQRKDYDAALASFALVVKSNDAADNPKRFQVMALDKIADIYFLKGDRQNGFAALNKAFGLANSAKAYDLLPPIYLKYSRAYAGLGDKDSAETYQLKYYQTKDKLLHKAKLMSVGRLHFLSELNKANEQVADLYHQRQVQTVIMIATTLVAICFIVFFVVTIRNLRKLKGAYRALYHKSLETLSPAVDAEAPVLSKQNLRVDHDDEHQIDHDDEQQIDHGDELRIDHGNEHKKAMDAEQMAALRKQIDHVLSDNSEICSVNFSLNRLAELIGQKYWKMSAIIKMIYGKNFNALLNDYRIKEACRRMNDVDHYGNYTIEAISASVGFKSRSNFVLTFKSITGLTPSSYQKLAKQEK